MANLTLTIDKTSDVAILLGGTTTFTLKIKNVSTNKKLYNLNIYLILPDGMTYSSASIYETSKIYNSDGTSKISWINLKDLVPTEDAYSVDITVKGSTIFKSGTTIPFGYSFNGIKVSCEMDTMPRGNYDVGNEKENAEVNMTFKAVRFYSTITTSGKVLKGAGTSRISTDYTKVYTSTCKFYNNSVGTSNVNITILLQNGIRYIGSITTLGTDKQNFLYPTVSSINIGGKIFTSLYYGNVTLSKSSSTTVNFKYSVWNRYDDNMGDFIVHGTKMNMSCNIMSRDDSVDSSCSFLAMDLIITDSINSQSVDVDDSVVVSYTYEVGGYYNVKDIVVDYIIPDGTSYVSSTASPYSAAENSTLKGLELIYKFPLAAMNSLKTVNISAKINKNYKYNLDTSGNGLPIVVYDNFKADTTISGTKVESLEAVIDSSNINFYIKLPNIYKDFLNGYYRDGTVKTISTLAPYDFAEYKLTYDASTLKAVQKAVYMDDFFPLSVGPINNINYSVAGYNPSINYAMDPHGVEFNYGDISGLQKSIINFKGPIKYLGTTGENINLLKMKGTNTVGVSYSNRTQVAVKIGTPNIQLTKTVTGPNKTAIRSNEFYSYIVRISNTNTLGTETDAFSFVLSDEFSSWFTVDVQSISISGTGTFSEPNYDSSKIQIPITKLAPGAYITLTYNVIINDFLPPGISIKTTATNTNPYSQLYDTSLDNYQYTNGVKSAYTTISSQNISVTKASNTDVFKVGSSINYTITVTVPIGTVVFDLYVKDNLLNGYQAYNGEATRNGTTVIPTVTNNLLTFKSEGYIDARNEEKIITYTISCKIIKGSKITGAIASIQNNTVQAYFKQKSESTTWVSVSKTLGITINYPNIVMNLSANCREVGNGYNITNDILAGSTLDFKLEFANSSFIDLVNGVLQIPIDSNYIFSSINSAYGFNANYDNVNKNIVINIDRLQPNINRTLNFTVVCQGTVRSGTIVNTVAKTISYYNDITTKEVYGGEQSNACISNLPAKVSLLPDDDDKIDDSTSYRVTTPGNIVTILNYLRNIGGGYDDYSLAFKSVGIPYDIYIDNIKIASISANTPFNYTSSYLNNMPPNVVRIIQIKALVPKSSTLGCKYNFVITAKSKTAPYNEKTVVNIDPV
ncbi:isopeptide-forming domain-containing fimbrial protein [Clostridium felsineum]|uniref:isopeptide-forming domain-containing fimbrial protein n=1 Tax=Clostridium felsineum TaxID=36839 RepID=UPI00214D5356|nr:isopeptide-forming domain-containing fimbrial protein [Clostridium felsineum]MCR3761430.1 isopeptide-forming domain-containing fimbrial protein [Clostridium felsineum]